MAAAKTSARQELTQIPPPLKSVYLNINQEPQWQNPFLSVEQNMIQLRIYCRMKMPVPSIAAESPA